MQRAALVATRVVGVGLGLWLAGCKDKAAPAIVDEDTIRWQMTSDTISYKPHFPSDNADFDVSCSISGGTVSVKITAAQISEEMRPRSVLNVTNLNPTSGTCFVTMVEAPVFGESEFTLRDSCKGTNPGGGCVVTGAFKSDGWDFNGTLTCTKLKQTDQDTAFTQLYDSVANAGPVVLKLDNCD